MRVLRWEDGKVLRGGRELVRPGGQVWIDCAPTPDDLAWLGRTFHFHPLALEDCANEDQRVKFEQYAESLFMVVHRIAPSADDSELLSHELDAFLAAGALVTVHAVPNAELDAVFQACATDAEILSRGPEFALYRVYDAVTDAHFALVDALTDEVEQIADAAVSRESFEGEEDLLGRILDARRMHGLLRKRLSPQREVFAALSRPGQTLVRDQSAVYFRDVVDHMVRLTEEIDTGRDLLASAMDANLSQTNNRLSAVMARLTLISTIFLPLNFVAGFFGMNLQILPAGVAVPVVLASVLVTPVALFAYFRHKRWL
ncbi:magnesium transporter CorA family protein [Anaeromyxobacter oryzae]|uniref:Magnesium transport protein CorA n=1 Tax=Anaeromyxobacter oryzae TaxID=2918170 RepID=A0ABM7X420_9BACT|nr:magnesium transporter CorA family protein [Anaeromyxobacter oryzae]BDG06545.1 magnesium transport protein CorA [Anaeromyxobacter oryzae]